MRTMERMTSKQEPHEAAGGAVPGAPGRKKAYVAPQALVFHPDREQAEGLNQALHEKSDSIALRLIDQVLTGGLAVTPHLETLKDKRIIIHLDDGTVYGPLECSSDSLAFAHCLVKLALRVSTLEGLVPR